MSSYVTIKYEWVKPGTPDHVAHQMFSIAEQLEDLAEPMSIAAEITRMDVVENFESQSDPDGEPWQAWSPNYEPFALAFGSGDILNLSGALLSAATSPSAFVPTNSGLFINTGGFPEYWAWNNFGASRSTGSMGDPITEGQVRSEAKATTIRHFRKTGKVLAPSDAMAIARKKFAPVESGTNELPARPFLGLSKEARAKIDAAFALWFEGTIAAGVSTTGRAIARHSRRWPKGTPGGLGGKFMPRDA